MGILVSIEEPLRSRPSVHAGILESMPLQIHQLSYNFGLAGMSKAETGAVAIGLRILAEVFEAPITIPGTACTSGINLVEVPQHSFDGSVQAIEVQTIKTYFLAGF